MDEAKAAMDTDDKNIREERWNKLIDHWHELFLEDYPEMDKYLEEITLQVPEEDRQGVAPGGPPGGRPGQERDPAPRRRGGGPAQGSTAPASSPAARPRSSPSAPSTPSPPPRSWTPSGRRRRSGICTTITSPPTPPARPGPPGSVNRREKGHGALAERALEPVIPSAEEFPYAIRVVSEVLSSNGSTSQGSICGSTLALMDAGVPIKAPVAGISCGLIQDDDGGFTTFIDIQGVEDFHGVMDFKVAGTKAGITAIQMDIKNDGLSHAIIKEALEITRDARFAILDEIMLPLHRPAQGRGGRDGPQDGEDEDRP